MSQTEQEFINAHPAMANLQRAILEDDRRIAEIKVDIDQTADHDKKERALAVASGDRPRGRPVNTPTQDRLTSLRRQLELAEVDLESAKAAVPLVEQRLKKAYPVQQNIDARTAKHATDTKTFCGVLTEALGVCQRWVRLGDEIAHLAGADVTVPSIATAGSPEAITHFQESAAEIVDELSGAAEQRRRAALEAQQAEQAEREAEITAGVATLRAAAEKFADVPAVRFARAVLESAVAKFHSTPKRTPDGSPNAGGDANTPGRLATWNAAGAAHAEYWHVVAKTAGMEEKAEFIPPMPDLGPMY